MRIYNCLEENNKIHKVFFTKASLAALIISSLALPSGSFFGIPVKYITYLLCLLALAAEWLKGRKISSGILLLFFFVTVFVTFFLLVGILRAITRFEYIWIDGVGFFTTMSIVLLIIAAKSMEVVEDGEVIAYVFYGIFIFALWKVSVVLLMVFGILTYDNVYAFFIQYVGYKPVTSEIYGGLFRFNFIIYDFIDTFFLFLIPAFPKVFIKIPVFLRVAFMIVGTACLIFAFSRFLFALVVMLWCFIFLIKFSLKQRLLTMFIVTVVVISALPWIEGAYEQRFVAVQSDYSDSIRIDQIAALMDSWEDLPLLGGGFGFYAKDYIRDPNLPFSYEVQWVSFLAKFGVFGLSFLLILVLLLFYNILREKQTFDHYILAFVLLCFILGGFTNQYLLNSASGVFYSLNLLIASVLRENAK